ncbi:MAG TPA: ThuA domain-containing protein [Candidatus Paceibacterota bacterium]|nr:ThuA domain-containing protein [Candidatus Paceibacterota bacterium]
MKMNYPCHRFLSVLGLTTAFFSAAFTLGAATPRLLVVSATKGFAHDVIPAVDKMLGDLSQKSGRFTVDYVRTDQDMADKMSTAALKNYDGVIFNNTTGDLPLPDRDAFLAWLKSGKGFVGLHAATDTFPGFPAYIDMIGGQFKTHDAQVEVKVLVQDRFHPATRHFDSHFRVYDEIYQMQKFNRSQVRGLLTLDKHPNTGVPGDYPIAWCKAYEDGRVFYTSLGHRTDVVQRPDFQEHVLMGILWATGEEPGDATPQSTEAKVSDDEAKQGFQSLFNGRDLTGWRLRNPDGRPSWRVENGMLVNQVTEKEHGTDLVTEEKYRDYVARYEYMIPKGANSGFYLRGRYEIQIHDPFPACKTSISSDGSFYNLAAPARFASLKPGEWNQVEVTLQGNRATVILNGVKIHDNVLLDRPTGGELDNKLADPGPFMLQGDHGSVAFRNFRVKLLP